MEGLGKRVEDELPQVWFSQTTPLLQAGSPLLKDHQHCHSYEDLLVPEQ